VRIDLVDHAQKRRRRPQDRRTKRGPSRAFDSAIALPEIPTRQGSRRERRSREVADPPARERQSSERRQQERRALGSASERRARRVGVRGSVRRIPVLLVLVALVGGIVYTSTDARFFVYGAEIHGAQHLAPTTIYEYAGVHEQNIFWIDPQQVAQRIIALDGIKVVRVSCELPAKVIIEVEERQPTIMWRAQSQGKDWWLDAEGHVLPYHGDPKAPDTVFVVDASQRHLAVGQTVKPVGIAQSVLQLAEALPDVQLFYYQADRGLSFTQQAATGSWPVYVGSSDNLPRKIQVMIALTGYLKANGIQPRYIDVRWADHPVYGRPAAENPAGGE
jgi:cell division septal protein FtsQ